MNNAITETMGLSDEEIQVIISVSIYGSVCCLMRHYIFFHETWFRFRIHYITTNGCKRKQGSSRAPAMSTVTGVLLYHGDVQDATLETLGTLARVKLGAHFDADEVLDFWMEVWANRVQI
jgi:hypothetical protein